MCDILTFNAIAAELPDAHVMQGASNVPAVQPRVGERNALSNKLSDPLLNSGKISTNVTGLGEGNLTSCVAVLLGIGWCILCQDVSIDQEVS